MRLNRKGDLALSTNAIVVLIIAVIILGLIITFVTQGFGAVSDKFFGQVSELPEPPTPSASRPVTSSQVMVAGPGEDFGLKIAIFNAGGESLTASPVITCTNSFSTPIESQVGTRTIPSREYHVFTYVAKLPQNAKPGKNLCTIVAATGSTVSGELIFEVRD
jgi:hypothetical protein